MPHVCPWWGGYFIDNRFRRLLHKPERILAPYVQPGMTVMDFGCGMGLFAICMARLVGPMGRVIAVDLQQKMLDILRKRAIKAGVSERIHAHRCTTDSIGIDEPVDFAVAFYSVHEVPEPARLFGEIHGLLRSRGQFLIVEPIGHVGAVKFKSLLSLSEDAGFQSADTPRIRLSRAALLTMQPPAEPK